MTPLPSVPAATSAPRRLSPDTWLREAQLGDCDAVAGLKQRAGLSRDLARDWDHLWTANPLARRRGAPPRVGWVLETRGNIVGFIGAIPHMYSYGARNLVAMIATSYVVDDRHRSHSLSLASAFFTQPGADLFISTTANDAATRVYQAFKAQPAPAPTQRAALFWTLRPYRLALAAADARQVPAIARRPLAIAAGAAAWTISTLGRRRPRGTGTRVRLDERPPEQIDEEFDRLWARRRDERPALLAYRTAEWLRWHFGRAALRGRVRLICGQSGGRLAGYVALRQDESAHIAMRRTRVVDLFVERDDPAVIDQLLAAAFEAARRDGSDVLELVGFGPEVRRRAKAGRPFERALPSQSFVYRMQDPAVARDLADAGGWHAMSPYDGDAAL